MTGEQLTERINKPRVFLSHSKSDVGFIERLCNDLRKCQIAPWLDSEEIRHGHSWLSSIFEDGIPTCDCVLVYLTENSTKSNMVKKEIDASIIQQLKDSKISFLPYVEHPDIRNILRPDLQSLQAPEWNESNYDELLPRVVSEIWRSFLERTVTGATQAEKLRRVEAELELQKLRSTSEFGIFTKAEVEDFQYIFDKLNRQESFTVEEKTQEHLDGGRSNEWTTTWSKQYRVNVASIVTFLATNGIHQYGRRDVPQMLLEQLYPNRGLEQIKGKMTLCDDAPDLSDELLMYGLLRSLDIQSTQNEARTMPMFLRSFKLVYTDKIHRFRYWMSYNEKLSLEIQIESS